MTLKFSESPAIRVREFDQTGIVPAVASTTGAIVGDFNWGPINTPILISNESELATVFGSPSSGNAYSGDFLSAAYFLKYSSSLYVVRSDRPTYEADDLSIVQGSNFAGESTNTFLGKYKGEFGNQVKIFVADQTTFVGWEFASLFSGPPIADERHIVVATGIPSIVANYLDQVDVVETYEYVSTDSNARLANGTNNYLVEVINTKSSWIQMNPNYDASTLVSADYFLSLGTDGVLNDGFTQYYTKADHELALEEYRNKDAAQIDFLIAPAGEQDRLFEMHQVMHGIVNERKDCVAVMSPPSGDSASMVTYVYSLLLSTSYIIFDANWLKVYNKYTDKYEYIPAASSTAGVMAASDRDSAPWFSPAGSRRGQYLGVTELLNNPTKTERDALYKGGINPIISVPSQGVMLFGDKTLLNRPSAFDRINVRRLFLVVERAISKAAEGVMFEFNDEFTRAEFVNIVEPFLREIQGRRGITDFRLVCDDTNNTPEVIDRNEFIATCFIKPARSINYVTLNFVAVRTGVDFEEVVGTI